MSRIPPSLLYLTIYNPTLKPVNVAPSDDDEDAEEQAHILFYTGRERAVSRDRILRQVGLSKALVNFASMFNATDSCESTHSQTRRMIMLSPEPDFWIHACVELAKTPRQPKAAPSGKGKGKGKEPPPAEPVFEYYDGSVHDAALREQIQQGYRQFKLTHGSFSSILNNLGQQALELQLERFFTVWAWKWDFEDELEFGEQLGTPMHQAYRDVAPVIDRFTEQHLPGHVTFVLNPPHLLPSTALLESAHHTEISRLVMQRIPPPPSQFINDESLSSDVTSGEAATNVEGPASIAKTKADEKKASEASKIMTNALATMDVRNLKWMWSGLTFGKGSSSKSTPAITSPLRTPDTLPPPAADADKPNPSQKETEVEVDAESLQDAIESENIHLSSTRSSSVAPSPAPASNNLPDDHDGEDPADGGRNHQAEHAEVGIVVTEIPSVEHGIVQDPSSSASIDVEITGESLVEAESDGHRANQSTKAQVFRDPPPTFLSTPVFLSEPAAPEHTVRRIVLHATKGDFTFAVVADEHHQLDLDSLGEDVVDLFEDVQEAMHDAHEADSEGSVLTVTNILEPQDRHIISTGAYTVASTTGFSSTSVHLFNAREILRSELDVIEVFSRGQNPQHWHIGRRGLGVGDAGGRGGELDGGEVYMEVARKESTLTDVDNGLASVVNRFSYQ